MTTNDEQNIEDVEPNYDIPAALMACVDDILPEQDVWDAEMDDEEREQAAARAFFVCVTAWNHAALPEDCAPLYLAQVAESFKEIDAENLWEDTQEDVMAISADIAEQYPNSTHIIVEHDMEPMDDGELGLTISIISVALAAEALREENGSAAS